MDSLSEVHGLFSSVLGENSSVERNLCYKGYVVILIAGYKTSLAFCVMLD